MENTNATVRELKAEQYQYNGTQVKSWRVNPYTWLKARFYMESSALLVYLLLKTKIKPNTVT
ncbi:MAG TPA: hypothetical protein PLV52_06075, partial [Candidatus Omnitrophota bacterium]|nr:hypothetical protein [Candidatus Omnitrophota bacterium]